VVAVDPAGCWVVGGGAVPPEEDWADAVAAPASAATRTTATRFNIRTRLLQRRLLAVEPTGGIRPVGDLFAGAWRRFVDETATAATADLPAFAAGRTGFVRRPFVGGSLLVRRSAAFARDLTLFFRRHRCEPAAFLAFSWRSTVCSIIHS
jgi:hypothetical protein